MGMWVDWLFKRRGGGPACPVEDEGDEEGEEEGFEGEGEKTLGAAWFKHCDNNINTRQNENEKEKEHRDQMNGEG